MLRVNRLDGLCRQRPQAGKALVLLRRLASLASNTGVCQEEDKFPAFSQVSLMHQWRVDGSWWRTDLLTALLGGRLAASLSGCRSLWRWWAWGDGEAHGTTDTSTSRDQPVGANGSLKG